MLLLMRYFTLLLAAFHAAGAMMRCHYGASPLRRLLMLYAPRGARSGAASAPMRVYARCAVLQREPRADIIFATLFFFFFLMLLYAILPFADAVSP